MVNDSADVTSSGMSFQVCGAATGKARLLCSTSAPCIHVHPPIANPGPVSVSTHIPDSFLEKVFTIVAQMTAPSSNNRSRQSTKLSGLGGHRVNDSDPAKIQNH